MAEQETKDLLMVTLDGPEILQRLFWKTKPVRTYWLFPSDLTSEPNDNVVMYTYNLHILRLNWEKEEAHLRRYGKPVTTFNKLYSARKEVIEEFQECRKMFLRQLSSSDIVNAI